MQLLNGPSRMESCNPLQKGQERYFSLAKKLLSHELIKMLALKPEGSQYALSSCCALLTAAVDLV